MKTLAATLVTLLLGVGTMSAQETVDAQARPDFSGTWNPIEAGLGRHRLQIAQDTSQLVVTEPDGDQRVYFLDGSESRYETASLTGEVWFRTSVARWISHALVVTTETIRESIGLPFEQVTIYTLEYPGNLNVTTADLTIWSGFMSVDTVAYTRQEE